MDRGATSGWASAGGGAVRRSAPVRELRLAAGGMLLAAAVWPSLPVHPPALCPLRSTTGLPCPLCGMTRAVVAAVRGDIAASLRFNPAGILVVLLALAIVLFGPHLRRLRPPIPAIAGVLSLLWVYNLTLNPTF